jgi:hypothetical protein
MSEPEPFASLLLPELSANTDAFLTIYHEGIGRTESSDRIAASKRFRLVHVHVNKSELVDLSEHELISTNVRDGEKAKHYNFFVERNAMIPGWLGVTPIQLFASASAAATASSAKLLQSTTVQQTATAPTTPSSETYPLIPLSDSEMPTSSSASQRLSTQVPWTNKCAFGDRFTLSSTRAVHSSSPSPECAAKDQILGRGKFAKEDPLTGEAQVIREIGHIICQLEPEEDLYLFEFGILIDVVHKEAPNYDLLKRQCYWFATTICEVITLLYGNKLAKKPKGARPTPNDYLPNIAGLWKNLLIAALEEDIVRRVAIKFMERREEEYSKVSFHYFCLILFLSKCLKDTEGISRGIMAR